MSLVYCDSFSGYATAQIPLKLNGGTTGGSSLIVNGAGRNGNNALSINDSGRSDLIPKLPSTHFIVTFGLLTNCPPVEAGSSPFFVFYFNTGPSSVAAATVALNNLGGFTAVAAGGVTAFSPNGIWFQNSYFGVGVECSASVVGTSATSTIKVYLAGNPTPVVTSTGTGTVPSGTPTSITDLSFRWQQGGRAVNFSDFTVVDATDGVFPTAFIGDVFVTPSFPDNVGVQTSWTPLANANWQEVSEHPPDGDTSYVSSNTPAQVDLYHFPAATGFLPAGSAIYGVQHNVMARKDTSGTRTIAPASYIASDASTHVGDSVSIGDSYDYYYKCWSVNPATASQWAIAAVGGAGSQFGQKEIS